MQREPWEPCWQQRPTVYALYDRNDLAAQACEELRRAGLAKQVYLTTFSDKTCIRK
ncbi:MAG: hypothetical protein ACLUOI_12405 [Eisenbergiella sp.]